MKTITSPEKQGFRDFDLPKEHLSDERHYAPPKAHDPAEVSRRRELSHGTLITETQRRGLVVARSILDSVTDQDGLIFATNLIAAAGINTAWYSYAQNSDVMRRRLKLPILAHPRLRVPVTIIDDSKEAIGKQITRADKLTMATDLRLRSEPEHQKMLGVGVGNMSLRLAMYESVVSGVFTAIGEDDELEAQELTRLRCLEVLEEARTLHRVVGSHPSIAQLSDPYSHLAVYWHRKAPGSAQSAISDALAS